MFSNLAAPPLDPILGLAQAFAADSSADKMDLGIGVYHDALGNAGVLESVKCAERWLVDAQHSKKYLSSAGNAEYNRLIGSLIMGEGSELFTRTRTIQTPGGTGALRLAADFIRSITAGARIFIPVPTWPNHNALFPQAGFEVVRYPYYDPASGAILFEEMMAALADVRCNDVVLLHGCCQNPTGADMSPDQWDEIAVLLNARGALPLVDLAYLGFGDGLEEDARALRSIAARVPEMLVASSCSKNFALYRERTGALSLVASNENDAQRTHDHAIALARTNWSMPPDHGAAVVAHILGTPGLRSQWETELAEMRDRINSIRKMLAEQLSACSGRDFQFIADQRGLFVQLNATPAAVKALRETYHVHMTGSGRMNVAGLKRENVTAVAGALAKVLVA